MRVLALAIVVLCVLGATGAPGAAPDRGGPGSAAPGGPQHGSSMYGDLKYPAGFAHFAYVDPKGRRYYWAMGTPAVPTEGEMTDLEAWQRGFITLTPLRIDRTETAMLERMHAWKLSMTESKKH